MSSALFAHWVAGSLGERAWRYTFRPLGVGCFIKNGFVQSPAVSCVRCFTRNHNNRKCRQSIGVAFALLYQLGVLPGRLRQESAQLQALPLHPVSSLRMLAVGPSYDFFSAFVSVNFGDGWSPKQNFAITAELELQSRTSHCASHKKRTPHMRSILIPCILCTGQH